MIFSNVTPEDAIVIGDALRASGNHDLADKFFHEPTHGYLVVYRYEYNESCNCHPEYIVQSGCATYDNAQDAAAFIHKLKTEWSDAEIFCFPIDRDYYSSYVQVKEPDWPYGEEPSEWPKEIEEAYEQLRSK
jgi:hypothetical protein